MYVNICVTTYYEADGGGASLTWRYDFPCCAAQEQEAIKFNVTLPRLATDAFYVGVSL